MGKNNRQQGKAAHGGGFPLRAGGFTLIEMMVTVGILAILLAMVAPSFRGLLLDNQAAAQADAVVTSLMFARSEAIKRNVPVVMCRSNTGTDCAGSDWASGWIVFADADRSGSAAVTTGDPILQVVGKLSGKFTLTTGTESGFTYRPDGAVTTADNFQLCPPDKVTSRARQIQVEASGRPVVVKGGTCS
jgi:type IV fimbrial biogenesis protein FimT